MNLKGVIIWEVWGRERRKGKLCNFTIISKMKIENLVGDEEGKLFQ